MDGLFVTLGHGSLLFGATVELCDYKTKVKTFVSEIRQGKVAVKVKAYKCCQ